MNVKTTQSVSTVAGRFNSFSLTVRHPAVSAAITWPELNTSWFEALAAAAGRGAPDGLETRRQHDADILSSWALFIHVIFVLSLVKLVLPLQRRESSSCLGPRREQNYFIDPRLGNYFVTAAVGQSRNISSASWLVKSNWPSLWFDTSAC